MIIGLAVVTAFHFAFGVLLGNLTKRTSRETVTRTSKAATEHILTLLHHHDRSYKMRVEE